jgi:hypothetical protein
MSVSLVVTGGYGNGALSGSISGVVLSGYSISTVIPSVIPAAKGLIVSGSFGSGLAKSGSFGAGVITRGDL